MVSSAMRCALDEIELTDTHCCPSVFAEAVVGFAGDACALEKSALGLSCAPPQDQLFDSVFGDADHPPRWPGLAVQADQLQLGLMQLLAALAPMEATVPNKEAVLPSPHKVRLSLEATLVPAGDPDSPKFDDKLSTIQWLHHDNWAAHCGHLNEDCLGQLPDGLQVPLESYYAMVDPLFSLPCADVQWELYVDGATSTTAAAWSVVVVRVQDGGTTFSGQLSGLVELDRTHPSWIGAESPDNIAAEFQAFVIALRLAHSAVLPGRVAVRPDLQLSRAIATFDCSTCSNPLLANLIRSLAYWLGRNLEVVEVRGHQGHPWNELADRLAKFALSGESPPIAGDVLGPLHQFANAPQDAQWAWLQHCPISLLHAFPPLCDGQVMQFPLSLRHVGIPGRAIAPTVEAPTVACTLSMTLVSVNVLALDPADSQRDVGRRIGARTQRLDAQWHAQGLQIIGLQEARTEQGVARSEHYRIWSSGHGPSAVTHGCELWCHLTLPIATISTGQKLTLTDFKVVVLQADERRLFVRFEHATLSFTVLVLHAPCLRSASGPGHRSIDDLKLWWQDTTDLIQSKIRDDLVWVLIDANAPLASCSNALYGLHGADKMNQQGYLFEEFLQTHQLAVPCTFAGKHEGPTATWTHPNGFQLRRDYILTSQAAFAAAQRSFVIVDHDSTFEHEDHLPVGLAIDGVFQLASHPNDRIRWDSAKLQDPQLIAAFQAALATLPIPTWNVNVDEHCHLFESNLLQLARQFFERTTKERVRPQLSASTISCIAFKRHILDCGRAWGLMQDPEYKGELRAIEKEVKARVFADLGVYYDQMLVQLQNAGDLGNLKEMHRILTRLGSRRPKAATALQPLPALRKKDGTLATSFTDQQKIWMQQFSEIEAGTQVNLEALQQLDRPGLGPPLDIQNQALFPSPWQLQSSLRKLKRGKAPGPNRLPPDVLKAGAAPFCLQLCAITTKAVAHCKEPLSWKGGLLVPLSKGKADSADPRGYRSIFISDFTAKLYHRSLRDHLVRIWERGIRSLQLGGRRRMGTDIAHHLLQAHGHWAVGRRQPYAHVFFDISSAFYSVLRQALFPDDEVPVSLIAALRRFRVQPADIDYMLHVSADDDATVGIDAHFRQLLKDALTNTHFFIQGLDAPCRTTRGTRPGDPLGDLLFNLVMSLIMQDARERILDATGMSWCGHPEQCSNFYDVELVPREAFLDLAFVDDCAVAIHADSIERVQEAIQAAVHAMAIAARGRGLLLNYAPGKTEVMFNMVGRGSQAAKAQFHAQGDKMCWQDGGNKYELRLVHCYKHLGTWLQLGAKGRKEVQARGTAAKQAWGALNRSFYAKPYVSVRSKTMAFRSLSLSRLLYNCHIWTPMPPTLLDALQNAIRKPLALMAKGHTMGVSPLFLDVTTLCGLLRLLPPADQIHMARLRYLRRLISICPAILWQLLSEAKGQEFSWVAASNQSLAWFRKFYSDHFEMPPTDELADWFPIISLDLNWQGRIKAAGQACTRFRIAEAEAIVWQKRFEATFRAGGGVLPDAPKICRERWTCEICNGAFGSKKALAAHAARSHGYRHVVLLYAVGDDCHVCCRRFHNRSRLVMHLRQATSCLQTIQQCFPPISDGCLAQLDEQEKIATDKLRQDGWGQTKALRPMCKFFGPCLPPPDSDAARDMKQKYVDRQPEGSGAASQLCGHRERPADEQPAVHIFAADFPEFVMNVPCGFQRGDGQFDSGGLALEYARLNVRSLVFIHFFSGYRRPGDLHAHLDHRVLGPGLELHVISVDLCLQRTHGNLLAPGAHQFWQRQIGSGRVIGAGGGPPCETFTAARMLSDGPRPLRSAECLWGLPSLSLREWNQVMVGTRLLHFLLDQLLLLACSGGCGFCEHPQYPVWLRSRSPPSIWAHPAMKALRQLPCCGVTSMDQCVFGAPATKPTTFLHLRLNEFREQVMATGRMGRCPHGQGAHQRLQGLESDGATFRTAKCKIYPNALNEALANAIVSHTRKVYAESHIDAGLPADFSPFCHVDFVKQGEVQPDYHQLVV